MSGVEEGDWKVVVLGLCHVGKTSLIRRYTDKDFVEGALPTIGAGFCTVKVPNGEHDASIMIWDTSGQERFAAITPSLLRGAVGMILVYDVTDHDSFLGMDKFLGMFLDTCAHGKPGSLPVLLLGNKSDCETEIAVSELEVNDWLTSNEVGLHYRVSAKTGDNVDDAFAAFITEVLRPKLLDRPPMIQLTDKPPEPTTCC
jgi:small GTP-binding protein